MTLDDLLSDTCYITVFAIIVIVTLLVVAVAKQLGKEKRHEKQRVERVGHRYANSAMKTLVLNKKIWSGMTRDQLINSWGQPLGRSTRVLRTKKRETFTYGSRRRSSKVHLENGVVVSWRQPD